MTNYQCYCYAVKAVSDILKRKGKLTQDTLYGELFLLWDIYSEKYIEEVVSKELYWDKINFEIQ